MAERPNAPDWDPDDEWAGPGSPDDRYGPRPGAETAVLSADRAKPGTPYQRNVNTGRIHVTRCNVKGRCEPVFLWQLKALSIGGTIRPYKVTASCCGASPGTWLMLHPEVGGVMADPTFAANVLNDHQRKWSRSGKPSCTCGDPLDGTTIGTHQLVQLLVAAKPKPLSRPVVLLPDGTLSVAQPEDGWVYVHQDDGTRWDWRFHYEDDAPEVDQPTAPLFTIPGIGA